MGHSFATHRVLGAGSLTRYPRPWPACPPERGDLASSEVRVGTQGEPDLGVRERGTVPVDVLAGCPAFDHRVGDSLPLLESLPGWPLFSELLQCLV